MENANLPVYSEVSEAAFLTLSVQRLGISLTLADGAIARSLTPEAICINIIPQLHICTFP